MIGKQIGNFRVIEKLGEGGMGVVYKAIDVHLDRPVAIKMLSADLARNPELVERFRSEARAQANLNHVNLATLYAFLVHEGNAFMVMEFVEGETLEQMIVRRGPIAPEDAIPWFKQALLGIGAAHRIGIVHRDIKPSNLMLNRQGIVKVMDFGIAKVVGTRGMTRTGTQLGTVAYMAPEQIQNRPIDVRTDIYSLGITLYQMLSGHVPFESDSDFQIMNDHLSTAPPPLTRMYPYAPVQYQNVVMKALEKSPDLRFQTVEEFGAALEHPETVPASIGAVPVSPGVRPTVVEIPGPAMIAGTAALATTAPTVALTSPQVKPAVAGPIPVVPPAPVPAKAKITWNSRSIAAGAIAGAAVILLAIVMVARKPPVAQAPAAGGVAPAASANSPSVKPEIDVTTTSLDNPVDPEAADNKPASTPPAVAPPPQVVTKPRAGGATTASGDAGTPQGSPTASSDKSAEFDELEHQIDQLTSRAAAVNNSLDRLQQQQAASGYGLRGDIVSRHASMQTTLSKAQSAIEQRDLARTKRYADLTAADLEVLEHFLGR